MMGNDGSNRSYRNIGISEGHHELSHHGGDKEKHEKIRRINRFHIEQLAYVLEKMQSVKKVSALCSITAWWFTARASATATATTTTTYRFCSRAKLVAHQERTAYPLQRRYSDEQPVLVDARPCRRARRQVRR
jgi:hypothetical protein